LGRGSGAGAIASNAGDDFHLVWACRKLLDLLRHDTQLSAISVEGPSWEDSKIVDNDKKLYSIDLAEYYGGSNFEDATRVVFSQLKYSSYQMDSPWTVANLCYADNKSKNNSIIRRLADTFCEYKSSYPTSIGKLEIKLVSNRIISPDFALYLTDAKKLLQDKKYSRTADLLKNLSLNCKALIQSIYKTSGLGSHDFVQFFQALNFDDCGTGIRSIQKAEISATIGNWAVVDIRSRYNDLIMHLREMMFPESRHGYLMDRDYVLATLKTTYLQMFPAPPRIQDVSHLYIERDVGKELAEAVLASKGKFLCVHATAGIGKTTLVSNIEKHFPTDSVILLYDCYGGGSFLQHSDRRHLPDVAIAQICNSLAAECGTEWIIGNNLKEYELLRALLSRLKSAVDQVQVLNPKAVIVLVIDAADNSKIAASTFNETCFIDSIFTECLPEDVYCVITSRSERLDLFTFPENTVQFQVPYFSLMESSQYLRFKFPMASDEECSEFHKLTSKTPRIQAYSLTSSSSVEDVLFYLRPDGMSTDSLFNGFINSVKKQYGYIIDVDALFASLINLHRPIPAEMIYALFNMLPDMLTSISIECHNGFYISDASILFKDEDFEAYLQNQFESSVDVINAIAEHMLQNHNTDAYSSRYVHLFLDKADHFSEMVQLSLNEHVNEVVVGIPKVAQLQTQRIHSTLKRPEMLIKDNHLIACKLVYKLIDLNASEETLNELLQNAPDEALMYCDELSLYELFNETDSCFSGLSKAALVYSKLPLFVENARIYIKSYYAAVSVYYSKREEERNNSLAPKVDDIVNIAEAWLALGEVDKAVKWIRSWSPKKYQADIVYVLIMKLIKYRHIDVSDSLLKFPWGIHCKLSMVSAHIASSKSPPQRYISELVRFFSRIKTIPDDVFAYNHLIEFFEYILASSSHEALLNETVKKIEFIHKFTHFPSLYNDDDGKQLSYALRFYVLKQSVQNIPLKALDFFMSREGDDVDPERSNERRIEVVDSIEYLFPVYKYRYACLKNEFNDFIKESNDLISNLRHTSWAHHSFEKRKLLEFALNSFADAATKYSAASKKSIQHFLYRINKEFKVWPAYQLSLLKVVVRDSRAHQFVLEVLEEVDKALAAHPDSAKELSESYLSCARVGQQIDPKVGKKFFSKAIECTKGLDYESYRKMHLFQTMAKSLSSTDFDQPLISYKVTRLAEDFCRKMGDTKNFPYDAAIEAATLLSRRAIWGAICRLDDRDNADGFSLQETFSIVLRTLLKNNYISLENVVSLLVMLLPNWSSDYSEIVNIILTKMSDSTPMQQKALIELLIHDSLHNLPLDEKEYGCQRLISHIKASSLSSIFSASEIHRMSSFIKKVNISKPTSSTPPEHEDTAVKKVIPADQVMTIDELDNKLKVLEPTDRDTFLTSWFVDIEPEMYVRALDWTVNLVFGKNYLGGYESTLETVVTIIEKLEVWPDVSVWRKNEYVNGNYLTKYAREFLNLYQNSDEKFAKYLRMFPMNADNQHTIFSKYITNNERCYNEEIVKALCRMTEALNKKEKETFLTWCLDLEMSKVHTVSGDSKNFTPECNEDDDEDGLASFLWRTLGHQDKGMRWRATHTLLRRCTLVGDSSILKRISALYYEGIKCGYIDSKNFFFIESARLWFLITCLRLSKDHYSVLLPLYQFFREIACSKTITHALHRRAARGICIALAPHCAPEDLHIIADCDKSRDGSSVNLPRYFQESENEKWEFKFDTMDTLPYWYSQLARYFGCTQSAVAKECDHYITAFKIDNQMCDDWRERFIIPSDYSSTLNRHGTTPRIESLEKYAEWHSMFYVADKFRIYNEVIYTEFDSYEEWLDLFIGQPQCYWVSEFRKHVPYVPFLWEFERRFINAPEPSYIIPDDLSSRLVNDGGKLTLSMSCYKHFEQTIQHTSIESAFVHTKQLGVIIKRLMKPGSLLSHHIVYGNESYFMRNNSIAATPTTKKIIMIPYAVLDVFDPLAKHYYYSVQYLMGLSDNISRFIGLSTLNQIQIARSNNISNKIIEIYHWNEPESESGYKRRDTSGHYISFTEDAMIKLLRQLDCALLFETRISIEDQQYQFYGTPSKPAKLRSIHVLKADGSWQYILCEESAR
jgi:hypothetical protein